jgi:hypothetical protein
MSEEPSLEREAYLEERRSLVDAEIEQARSYDKAILTLSAGALALSLTFVHELAPKFDKWTIGWLVAAWAAFILSLLATLISFQVSQWAFREARDSLDALHERAEASAASERAADLTKAANIASLGCFIVGAIFLVVFVSLNIGKSQ